LLDRAIEREAIPKPANSNLWPRAAMVAGVFLFGVGVGSLMGEAARQAPSTVAADAQQAATVPVRLVLHAPDARTVAVAGSWNDWQPQGVMMQSVGAGVFRVELDLERGRHEYMFVVDGETWVTDETASIFREDGFGNKNAVLEI